MTFPLPPDPEGMNDDRAQWAQQAITTFAVTTGMAGANEENITILGDLLADIMHWCDRNDLRFEDVLAHARSHYQEETTP